MKKVFIAALGLVGLILSNDSDILSTKISEREYKQTVNNPMSRNIEKNIIEDTLINKDDFLSSSLDDKRLAIYDSLVSDALDKSLFDTVIIVNKSNYTLDVVSGRLLLERFSIELGRDPVNDKWIRGDNRTPEGSYIITTIQRQDRSETSFYISYLLNYPNAEDKYRFKQRQEAGLISKDAKIGHSIMIHGNGSGKKGNAGGINWTEGCVALADTSMDRTYPYVKKGTSVTIVGDTRILYEYNHTNFAIIRTYFY